LTPVFSNSERRQYPRVEKKLPLKLSLEGYGEYDGVTRNISAGGVFFELSPDAERLPILIWPDSKIKLMLELSETDQTLEALGEITWVKKSGSASEPGGLALGIRFEGMAEDHRTVLADYLKASGVSARKVFIFEKTVYLSDTNMEGNVYFARYFEWQGEAREALFQKYFPISLFQNGYKLITVNASTEYKSSSYLYDEILIEVSMANIKHLSVQLIFKMINKNTKQLIALGSQKIALANPEGEVIVIPEELLAIARILCTD